MSTEILHTSHENVSQEVEQELSIIHWWRLRWELWLWDQPEKRDAIALVMRDVLRPIINPIKIQEIKSKNWFYSISYTNESGDTQYAYFDIFSESFSGNSLEEAEKSRESNKIYGELQNFWNCISAMESILQNNEKESFDFLDEKDVLTDPIWEELQGKTIKEIQLIARENSITLDKFGFQYIPEPYKSQWESASQKYLDMVMWIWDINEGWSKHFHKTQWEVIDLCRQVIASKPSITEAMDYYSVQREIIRKNKRNSKTNERATKMYLDLLWRFLFQRMETEDSPEINEEKLWEFLRLAEMMRWKKFPAEFKNPSFAAEILFYTMEKKGWLLEKIDKSKKYDIKIEDPKIGNKRPKDIMNGLSTRLWNIWIPDVNFFMKDTLWVSQSLLNEPGNDYNKLSIGLRQELSILVRLLEKLNGDDITLENIQSWAMNRMLQEIQWDAIRTVQDSIDDNFWATWRDWNGIDSWNLAALDDVSFSPNELKAFDLFRDISGSWAFDFSDSFENGAKSLRNTALKIIAVVAVVAIVTAATGWVALPAIFGATSVIGWAWLANSLIAIWIWASAWTVASLWFVDPRWHDSMEEMVADVGTDFVLNTFHAVAFERLIIKSWWSVWRLGKTWLIWGDLWTWISLEIYRDKKIEEKYHWQPLFQEEE